MRVRGAVRPGGAPPGQDRWTRTDRAVIVLDGATASDPDSPSAGEYVDALLAELTARIDGDHDLRTVLRDAITAVTHELDLRPGGGPSSTVLLLRETGDVVEVAALGDSTAVLGFRGGGIERLTDDRMQKIAAGERRRYRERLAAGHGYDDTHRELLKDIQKAERAARNRPDGYWIAEADPAAAGYALQCRFRRDDLRWSVLATDGAQRVIDQLAIPWSDLPSLSDEELHEQLAELQRWEAADDPHGRQLPRSKRHDDKTLVTWGPADLRSRPWP